MSEIVDYQGKPVPLTADELRMLKQLELYEGSDIRSWRLITIRLALKVEVLEAHVAELEAKRRAALQTAFDLGELEARVAALEAKQ